MRLKSLAKVWSGWAAAYAIDKGIANSRKTEYSFHHAVDLSPFHVNAFFLSAARAGAVVAESRASVLSQVSNFLLHLQNPSEECC